MEKNNDIQQKNEGKEVKNVEISGNRAEDLKAFTKSKNVDLGIKLLEYYVPKNVRLIEYCKKSKDIAYITENLKAILNGRS